MNESRLNKVSKFFGQMMTIEKRPEIRWDSVVRIEAFGTDVVSAFAIMVTFHYADGSETTIHPEQRGYHGIVKSLNQRFPSISPNGFQEMRAAGKESFDVERTLLSQVQGDASK